MDAPVPGSRGAIVERLSDYDSLLEVGVGRRPGVAAALAAAGASVTAVDVREVPTPDGVRFVRDDVRARSERDAEPEADPERPDTLYRVEAVYGLNLPRELHRPAARVADRAGADCLFTTLGFEAPAVPVERLPAGRDTLYRARPGP